MTCKKPNSWNKGFTLLEILIALAILVVGVAAVVNMFPVGLHASKRAVNFTSVTILAQQKMAELMYVGYDNVNRLHGNLGTIPTNMGTGTKESFPSPDEEYEWHIDLADADITNLAKATLWIYWTDRGVGREQGFVTYVAKYN